MSGGGGATAEPGGTVLMGDLGDIPSSAQFADDVRVRAA